MNKNKEALPPIRHSMRSAFKTCPRKTFWEFVAGVEARRNPIYFCIGHAYHKGLELWRRGSEMDDACELALVEFERECAESRVDITPDEMLDDKAKIAAYLHGYIKAYPEDQQRDWGEPELQIVTRGYLEQGTIDAHFKDTAGFTWIVDDKSRAMMTRDLDLVTRQDEQLLNYATLLTTQGHNVKGAFLREVCKAGIKRTKKEGADDYAMRVYDRYTKEYRSYYQEARIEFDPWALESFYDRKTEMNHVMRSLMGTLHDFAAWPWNGDNCSGKYGPCEYLQLCATRNDSDMNYKPTDRRPLDGGSIRKAIWGYDPKPAPRAADSLPVIDSPPI
jgi:hypothetical protein